MMNLRHKQTIALLQLIILSVIALSVQGCFSHTKHIRFERNQYATGFSKTEKISYGFDPEHPDVITAYAGGYTAKLSPNVTQAEVKKVEAIARKFGDTCTREVYDEHVEFFPNLNTPVVLPNLPNNRCFLDEQLIDIDVVSTIDWSEDLPAGSSLKDHFYALVISYGKYAQTCTKNPAQPMPQDLDQAGSEGIVAIAKEMIKYQNRARTSEVFFDRLDQLPFRELCYLGGGSLSVLSLPQAQEEPCFNFVYLASPSPKLKAPQTLTFTTRFKGGHGTWSTLTIE